MICRTTQHGQIALNSLLKATEAWSQKKSVPKWIVLDTETRAKKGFPSSDALTIGRAEILVTSLCFRGESYTFPACPFNLKYPAMREWAELLNPVFQDQSIIKVLHNANYDVMQFRSAELRRIWNVFCTMIAAWKTNADLPKDLKSRAVLLGRHLQKTAVVDFNNEKELAEYAEGDVIATDELFQLQFFGSFKRPAFIPAVNPDGKKEFKLNPMPLGSVSLPDETLTPRDKADLWLQEFPYLRATLRAEAEGIAFNLPLFKSKRAKILADTKKALKAVYEQAGYKFNLGSGPQKAELFEKLKLKNPYRTKKGKPCFDKVAMAKLASIHPIVAQMQENQKLATLLKMYFGSGKENPKKASELGYEHFVTPAGKVHCSINTVGSNTGRTTAQRPNFLQVPRTKDIYGIREAIVSGKGRLIICLDYAQLELRIGALYSLDPVMVEYLCDPTKDLHTLVAERFKVDRDKIAKPLNFLLLFGGGAYMLSMALTNAGVPTSESTAQVYIDQYDSLYSGIRPWRESLCYYHQRHGFVYYLTGRKRRLLDIDWDSRSGVHKAETTLANNTVQGGGQDFLKATVIRADPLCINPDAMVLKTMDIPREHALFLRDNQRKIEKQRKQLKLGKVKFHLQIHDEGFWTADEKAAEDMGQILGDIMVQKHFFPLIAPYSVPLICDGGIGESWAEAKSKTNKRKITSGWEQWKKGI